MSKPAALSAVWICSTPGPVSPRRTLSLGLETTRGAASSSSRRTTWRSTPRRWSASSSPLRVRSSRSPSQEWSARSSQRPRRQRLSRPPMNRSRSRSSQRRGAQRPRRRAEIGSWWRNLIAARSYLARRRCSRAPTAAMEQLLRTLGTFADRGVRMTERQELLDATDEMIEDAVRFADPMVLRGLLYQLTGDETVAATEVHGRALGLVEAMVLAEPADAAMLQSKAADLLKSYRDSGVDDVPIGPAERLPTEPRARLWRRDRRIRAGDVARAARPRPVVPSTQVARTPGAGAARGVLRRGDRRRRRRARCGRPARAGRRSRTS